jgi:hypothetical protein
MISDAVNYLQLLGIVAIRSRRRNTNLHCSTSASVREEVTDTVSEEEIPEPQSEPGTRPRRRVGHREESTALKGAASDSVVLGRLLEDVKANLVVTFQ